LTALEFPGALGLIETAIAHERDDQAERDARDASWLFET